MFNKKDGGGQGLALAAPVVERIGVGGSAGNALNLLPTEKANAMVCDAAVAVFDEHARAYLANTALENLGALTALEQYLAKQTPLERERFSQIVNAYAIGATRRIMAW